MRFIKSQTCETTTLGHRDVLNGHETVVGLHGDSTCEELSYGTHILEMNLVTVIADTLVVADISTVSPTRTFIAYRVISLDLLD